RMPRQPVEYLPENWEAWIRFSGRPSKKPPASRRTNAEDCAHQTILRPEGLDTLGDIAIVDVCAVDFQKVTKRCRTVARCFEGRSQLVMQCSTGLLVQARQPQGFFVPAHSGLGNALVKEALRQPGVSLHDLIEALTILGRLADFLELTDCFIKQAHLAE